MGTANQRLTFGSLFAGIGGMDLGLERAGWGCRWQVEISPFCQTVLEKHWPDVKRYGDITKIDGSELEPVDLIAGGFPCQDLSVAGMRRGIREGTRSGLWADFARLIGVLRPRFVLIENVSGLLANEPMRRVLGDLSTLGFDAEWESLPAACVGAPHIRDRVWVFAYSRQEFRGYAWRNHDRSRCDYVLQKADDRITTLRGKDWKLIALAPGVHQRSSADWWLRQSSVARSVNGVPRELVDDANSAFGNAVVPEVAQWVGTRIRDAINCGFYLKRELSDLRAALSRLEAQPTEIGVGLIAEERQRQISVEGWTAAHDDTEHRCGDLTQAALSYAEQAVCQIQNADYVRPRSWPWDLAWWKPSPDPIRNLVKAGALIAAEIDRLRRVDASSGTADDQIPAVVVEAMRAHIGPESDAAFIERKIAEAQPEIPESAGELPTPPSGEKRP